MMVAIMTIRIMVIMMKSPFSGLQVLQPERYRSPATRCTLITRFDNIDNLKNLPLEEESVLLSDDQVQEVGDQLQHQTTQTSAVEANTLVFSLVVYLGVNDDEVEHLGDSDEHDVDHLGEYEGDQVVSNDQLPRTPSVGVAVQSWVPVEMDGLSWAWTPGHS